MALETYDVVVLGSDVASLCAAALLAKRRFRVALVQLRREPAEDEVAGRSFLREPEAFCALGTPVWAQTFSELSLDPRRSNLAVGADGPAQVVVPQHRWSHFADTSAFHDEAAREFIKRRRPVENFSEEAHRISAACSKVLRPAIWPPSTPFGKLRAAKAASALGLKDASQQQSLLRDFLEDHPFLIGLRSVLALHERGADVFPHTDLSLSRLYTNWLQGTGCDRNVPVGTVKQWLMASLLRHNGQVYDDDVAEHLAVSSGRAMHVRLRLSRKEIGCDRLVSGAPLEEWERIAEVEALVPKEKGEPVSVTPAHVRYAAHIVVEACAVPPPMRASVYLTPTGGHAAAIRFVPQPCSDEKVLCLTGQTLVRFLPGQALNLADAKRHILQAFEDLAPHTSRFLHAVSSPFDEPTAAGDAVSIPALAAGAWSRGPSYLPTSYAFSRAHTLGLCALPTRTALSNVFLCGSQVIPGLGHEGWLLSAWKAVDAVTRTDRKYKKIRRSGMARLGL